MSLDEARRLRSYSKVEGTRWDGFSSIRASGRDLAAAVDAPPRSVYVDFGLKRLFDIVFAGTALLILLPIFPIVMIALLIQDGTPVFFRQDRMGRDGKRFPCLKFRSMARDAEERLQALLESCHLSRQEWETTQKLKSDPRIHWVGDLIRKASIDELPQIINVLRGEMSIVGPRPILPEQVALYGAGYRDYVTMRPGLTGLWQVSGRNKLTFSERVDLDAEYGKNVTFLGDLRIIGKTFLVVLMGHGSF